MKNIFAAIALSVFTTVALAGTNVVPTAYDFETGTAGDNIIEQSNGWVGAEVDAAKILGETYIYTKPKPLPDPHTKILSITAEITNEVSSSGSEIVYVDTMINPTPWDLEAPPVVPAGAQVAAYVNTNGHLAIWHKIENSTNQWTVLEDTSITTDEWFRLTFKMDYVTTVGFGLHTFSVILDGQVVTNATGAYAGTGGERFLMAFNDTSISSVTFQGTAKIDDFHYATNNPNPDVTLYAILSSVDNASKVAIAPLGTTYVEENSNQTYTITTVGDGVVGDVLVDSVSIGATNSYTFLNVTNAHTIEVIAAVTDTTNGVPIAWLDSYGITGGVDTADTDGDGTLDWQEYAAGTIPDVSNSVFRILDVVYDAGGTNSVSYYASTNSGVTNGINIMRTTNLIDSTWITVQEDWPRAADGTNVWWDTAPPADPAFYKPVIIWVVE
ncbi:MAG: hypothetical protein KAI74_00050 [Kiritimatiellae bacterium]|nr:hypothetical protein [Kiritimatiellia bacterium]